MTEPITYEDLATAERFFAQVCILANDEIARTHRVEGMHYNAMQVILKSWREQAEDLAKSMDKKTHGT